MTLERFLRLAAKKILGFHVRTRTDISLSMLGWKSVVSQIDYRKLSFLGRLCNMPNTVHAIYSLLAYPFTYVEVIIIREGLSHM